MRSVDEGDMPMVKDRSFLFFLILSGLLFILTLIPTVQLLAEPRFSGELKPEVTFNVPGEDEYETVLNEDNRMALEDLMFGNEIHLKMDETGESAALDLWIRLAQYPVGDLISGTAALLTGGDPLATGAVSDLSAQAGAYIYTADLMRASVLWMPDDDIRITAGRQSFLTGYGYGWNPADLANPPKNPTDPTAYQRGVDGLSWRNSPLPWLDLKLYGILPSEGNGWDYAEVLAGAEATLQMPALEIKLMGLYGGEEKDSDGSDAYPHAGAAALYLDLFGIGFYGESVLRSRSRRNSPDADGGMSELKDDPVFSGLAGAEYYFASGISGALEYFYNGEGWDDGERRDYASALKGDDQSHLSSYTALYTPLYFAKHYILVNLGIPWYEKDCSFNLNLISSPDSASLIFTPSAELNLDAEGSLTAELRYSALSSWDDDQRGESYLSPVRHSFSMNMTYFF
jgi:hypothetical protein